MVGSRELVRRSAWSLLWAIAACGGEGPSSGTENPDSILTASAAKTGFEDSPALFQLVADASVEGPTGTFRTRVVSSSDGRVRMEQPDFGFAAGVGALGGWRLRPDGVVDSLGAGLGFVRGHELHMLLLRPEARLARARYRGGSSLGGVATRAVALSLPSGDSIVAHFAIADSLPVGFVTTWTDPHVEVLVSDWVERSGYRLFTAAVFRQGEEEFRYRFDSVRVGQIPDDVFEPGGH